MPEKKFKFSMLREHLRKWWGIYVIGIVVICFANNLVFTVTRPQVPDDETVRIMLLDVYADGDSMEAYADELLNTLATPEGSLHLVQFENLLNTSDQYSDMLVVVKLASGYSDLFITDESGFESLCNKSACMPLEDIIAADDPRALRCTDKETGESYIGGLNVTLANPDLFHTENAILVISAGTDNPEDTLAVMDLLIDGGLK